MLGGVREEAPGRDSKRVEPESQPTPSFPGALWDPRRNHLLPAPDKSPRNCTRGSLRTPSKGG